MATGLRMPPAEMSQKKVPSFFQFMLPGFTEKLSLPPAFHKHLMGKKYDKAILKSPLGVTWHVKVCGGKEGMWFEDGWFDFVQGHGLQLGECLVFSYDGDMVFYVTAFDTSACEKKLPLVKKDYIDDGKQRDMEEKKKQPLAQEKDKDTRKQSGNLRMSCSMGAKGFTSYKAKNLHFAATIGPANILTRKAYLNIPVDFRRSNDLSRIQKITLTDPKRRSWPVKITHTARGDIYFSTGWNTFQVINGLQVGDVCTFKFTDATKSAMNVHIRRRSVV